MAGDGDAVTRDDADDANSAGVAAWWLDGGTITPFLRIMFAYKAVSVVAITANARSARR